MSSNPLQDHRTGTLELAKSLQLTEIYYWLIENGYFPESYVLPPCFQVASHPDQPKRYSHVKNSKLQAPTTQLIDVHFPKSEFTDRNFGIMHPEHYNDIAYLIAHNWECILQALIPTGSKVVSYSFPIPLNSRQPGRLGELRSGRMIYEYIGMAERDLPAVAYQYSHIVHSDIKNFYPSIYTHSIAWALHGKSYVREANNRHNDELLGNQLDRLFQRANDGQTNGIPIGPAVSDVISEVICGAVDKRLTKLLKKPKLHCEIARYKDDYRILVRSEADGRRAIKALQTALNEYSLEINEDKTTILELPAGLFRPWVSMYHQVHPKKRKSYSRKQFRELYLAVLRIDSENPGCGVIDRFLADIVTEFGELKVEVRENNLQNVISMLIMLATKRVKSFPKVLAIIEVILKSKFGELHRAEITNFLKEYLTKLAKEEERNKYLITWIGYFLVSNRLKGELTKKPSFSDPVMRSVFNNRGYLFKGAKEHKLFTSCVATAKNVSMFEHLRVFEPPKILTEFNA